jgi:CRP/FNR family transcriptional regulator
MSSVVSPSVLHPLFRAPSVLLDLVQTGETITVDAHASLFREGDPVQYLYCVAEGTMVLSRYSVAGERQIMAFLFPGDFLGITFEKTFSLGAETLTKTTLLRLEHSILEDKAAHDPEVWRALSEVTWRFLRGSMELTFTIGRKSAASRLASFLIYLALRQGGYLHPAAEVNLPMSRQDIGDFLGLTIETVSRSFTKLKERGCIALPTTDKVDIVNFELLRENADIVD